MRRTGSCTKFQEILPEFDEDLIAAGPDGQNVERHVQLSLSDGRPLRETQNREFAKKTVFQNQAH